ncbi:MAG: hypothetical protein ACRD1B_10900 [Thermoanaerobaculia bacterium]
MKSAVKMNFHVPLSGELYEELKSEAKRRGRPATAVARHAIAAWLRQARRLELHEEISAYARRRAGSVADLDPDLEVAGIDALVESEE